MQQISAELGEALGRLAFNGVGPLLAVALLMLLFFAGNLLAKAVKERLEKIAKTYVGNDRRALLLAIFGLPAIVAGALGQFATAVVMVGLGIPVWLSQARRRSRKTLRRVAIVAVVVLCVSLWTEGEVRERLRRRTSERLMVYVVFPFQPLRGEDPGKLRGLSMSLRGTFQSILGSIADVSVEPVPMRTKLKLDELDTWSEHDTVIKVLRDDGVDPDVLLVNRGGFTPDEAHRTEYLRLLLRPRLIVWRDGRWKDEPQEDITGTGKSQDITYLAIRATLKLVEQIKGLPETRLTPAVQNAIIRKAALRYLDQLEADGCPGQTCEAVRAAIARPSMTLEEITVLTTMYPPDETARLEEVIEARANGTTAKIARPAEEPPRAGPANSQPPPTSAAPAPAPRPPTEARS